MVSMVYLNGPPPLSNGILLQQTLEASPNTGNNIARFAQEMERAMAEQKVIYVSTKDSEREKEKKSRIRAVAQIAKGDDAGKRDLPENKTTAGKKLRLLDEDFKEELYDNPLLGLSVDYKA